MYELKALIDFKYKKIDKYIKKGDIIIIESEEETNYLCGNNKDNIVACELIRKFIDKKAESEKPARKRRNNVVD